MSAIQTQRFPDLDRLTFGLAAVFRDGEFRDGDVVVIKREPNYYESTFPTEIVTCRLGGSGRTLRLFCKYGTREFDGVYGHRGNVQYEAEVYREVLRPLSTVATATCYGAYRDEHEDAWWLVLEYLEGGSRTNKSPDPEAIIHAARWSGKFHAASGELLRRARPSFLRNYDADYYLGWSRRTDRTFSEYRTRFPWLSGLCEGFVSLVPRLLRAPLTIIHGEYYPSNVIYLGGTSRPIDWQSAAIAAGEIDLASLTQMWPNKIASSCEEEYKKARWPGVSRPDYDFEQTLDVARVYMLLRWLGDPGRGSPLLRRGGRRILPKASVKFIEELRKVGRRLRLA